MEKALQELAANNNIFVGTVDYGDMLFFPKEIEKEPANRIPVATMMMKKVLLILLWM